MIDKLKFIFFGFFVVLGMMFFVTLVHETVHMISMKDYKPVSYCIDFNQGSEAHITLELEKKEMNLIDIDKEEALARFWEKVTMAILITLGTLIYSISLLKGKQIIDKIG